MLIHGFQSSPHNSLNDFNQMFLIEIVTLISLLAAKDLGFIFPFLLPALTQEFDFQNLIQKVNMNNEKNQLFKQTAAQRSPGLAKPEDFKINPPDTNKDYPFHGQLGDSKRECDDLLKMRETGRPKYSETNYETLIQKELARENTGSKQVGE